VAVEADEGYYGYGLWYVCCARSLTTARPLIMAIELNIYDRIARGWRVEVHNKIHGQDKGIVIEGHPVATMSRLGAWKHVARHDLVHVAPGMDILLALGVNWIRADKQKQDAETSAIVC